MRAWQWWTSNISVVLVALAFCPNLSVALDCSYNKAFNPPLPVGGVKKDICVASGSLKSKRVLQITASLPKLEVQEGIVLKLRSSGDSPGSLIIDENGSLSGTELSDSVIIDAAKEIISNGHLQLSAPEDILRLRAAKSIQLLGQGTTGNTALEGDSVKLESSKGNIILDGVSISAEYVLEINAFKGDMTIKNSTFSVGEVGEGAGPCRLYAKGVIQGLDDPSNHFDCLIVTPTPK